VGRPHDEEGDDEMAEAWSLSKARLICFSRSDLSRSSPNFSPKTVKGAWTGLGVTEGFIGVSGIAIISAMLDARKFVV
jgi:hypothetical protein